MLRRFWYLCIDIGFMTLSIKKQLEQLLPSLASVKTSSSSYSVFIKNPFRLRKNKRMPLHNRSKAKATVLDLND